MIDNHLYELEKKKEEYIQKNNNQSSINMKKYFNPIYFPKSDFEIFTEFSTPDIDTMKKTIENRIACRNEMYGVNWCLNDTYLEIEKLKNSGNDFLMYIAEFCTLAADVLIKRKDYNFSRAFFSNARYTELVLFMKLQDVFDIQVTLMIVTQFWIEYVNSQLESS